MTAKTKLPMDEGDEDHQRVAFEIVPGDEEDGFQEPPKAMPMSSSSSGQEPKTVSTWRRLLGITCMICSQICFFLQFFIFKAVSKAGIQGFQLATIRGLALIFWNTIAILLFKLPVKIERDVWSRLIWRGIYGTIGFVSLTVASLHLKLAESQSLFLVAPFGSALLGRLYLNEKLTRVQFLAMVFSFIGVLIILRPNFLFGGMSEEEAAESASVFWYAVPLIGAFAGSMAYFQIRAMGNRIHFIVPVYAIGIVTAVAGPPLQFLFYHEWVEMSFETLGTIFCAGTIGWLAQILLSRAFQIEKLAISTAMGFIQVPLSMIVDSIYFSYHVFSYEIIGSLAVFCGLLVLSYSKLKSGQIIWTIPEPCKCN